MSGLGEALVTLRHACGFTQADLADRAGVTQAALSRYESDLRTPEDAVIDALAEFGVTHMEMPVTPESIWRAIRAGKK